MAKEGRGLKFETPLYKRDRDRLRAQVARQEADKAAKDAALRDMVAIAAERLVQFPADGYFRQLYDIGGAALSSDADKGWLPPEALRFIWIMREVARTIGGRDDPQMMSWYYAAQSELWRLLRATLDALKGVE